LDLMLYIVLIVISLVLIFLYFYEHDHSELGIVGFLFLFLLSLVMIGGDIQYKVGVNETYTYGCLCCEQGTVIGDDYTRGQPPEGCTNENATIAVIGVDKVDDYSTFTAGGVLSHTVGYYLAVAAAVGFIGVFLGLKSQFNRRREEED
jgi:hypothetical protein